MTYRYKTDGGEVDIEDSTYVKRKADADLLESMRRGEYCYVFSARQMGKTSLLVRTKKSLEQEGGICVEAELNTEKDSSEKWYKNMIRQLGVELKVFSNTEELDRWLNKQKKFSASTYLKFIDEVVLNKAESEKIYIFYDEIYRPKAFTFSIDEFWIAIRRVYTKRKSDNRYKQLTFAFFGVATPNDLIKNKSSTILNIGKAIKLTGIKLKEADSLLFGLKDNTEDPKKVLNEILNWTGGQPFLTQQFCEKAQKIKSFVYKGEEKKYVEQIADYYIHNWQDPEVDSPQHFRTIHNEIRFDTHRNANNILITYQSILQAKFVNETDYFEGSKELLLLGLVEVKAGKVTVFNRLYKKVFNEKWIEKQIDKICHWSRQIEDWAKSKDNKSYLLRGKQFKNFEDWAKNRRLTEKQESYMNACNREKYASKFKWSLLWILSGALGISVCATYKAISASHDNKIQKIEAINSSSKALSLANNDLDALKEALNAEKESDSTNNGWHTRKKALAASHVQASVALSEAIYSSKEYNRFSGHEDTVSQVAISRDGNTIVSGSWDKTIKLWEKDGTLIRTLGKNRQNGHQQEIKALAISRDRNLIVSGSTDETIKLWKKDGTLIRTLEQHTKPVEAIAISPDGKLIVSGSDDKTIKFWQKDGTLLDTINQTHTVKAVVFSPDGKTIASGSEDKTIKLWDVDTRKEIKSLEGHQQGIREIAFGDDGKTIVSASADSTLKLWDINAGKEIKTFEGHDGPVYGMTINPENNTIVSAGVDKTIRIWSIESGRELATLKGHEDRVEDVTLAPDDKTTPDDETTIVSASWDSTVRLWRPNNRLSKTLVGHDDVVIGVDFGSDLIASASDDRKVKLWRRDGTLVATFNEHTAEVYAVAISPDGQTIVSAGADNEIKLWDEDTKSSKTIGRHEAAIWDLAITPDGQKIVSASSDNTLKIWDKNNNNPSKAEATLRDHQNVVWTVAISADGQTIVSGGADNTVRLWNINGKQIEPFEPRHKDAIWAVDISADGQTIVSGGEDSKVIFWNSDGKVIKEIDKGSSGHTKAVKGIAISPDGELVASASADKTIKIWSKDGDLKMEKTIPGHDGRIWDVAFSPDGKSLVSASEDKTLIVWDLKEILELNEQEYGCNWIRDYLKHNSEVEEEERTICD